MDGVRPSDPSQRSQTATTAARSSGNFARHTSRRGNITGREIFQGGRQRSSVLGVGRIRQIPWRVRAETPTPSVDSGMPNTPPLWSTIMGFRISGILRDPLCYTLTTLMIWWSEFIIPVNIYSLGWDPRSGHEYLGILQWDFPTWCAGLGHARRTKLPNYCSKIDVTFAFSYLYILYICSFELSITFPLKSNTDTISF